MAYASYTDYNMPEPETLMECPYNKAHMILKHRFQTHLVKCARSNGGKVRTIPCKYNSAHRYPANEIKDHEANCESKIEVLRFMYQESKKEENVKPLPTVSQPRYGGKTEENWDDSQCDTYNPKNYCFTQNIVNHIQHYTPSERKAFREAERRRLMEFDNQSGGDSSQK